MLELAKGNKQFAAIDRAIGKDSFRVVLLLRLSPLLPLALSNYLYGLTSVDLVPYILGSWLGMLPGTLAYVTAGDSLPGLPLLRIFAQALTGLHVPWECIVWKCHGIIRAACDADHGRAKVSWRHACSRFLLPSAPFFVACAALHVSVLWSVACHRR